ncbi:hypothetical protein CEP51_000030 [Fusarium floridanum]|uniref:C2H2-type domain-containing protein n=1 Tax=Fusarium floridanum TaxID=1325733 RepID=A0A428SQ11_9HYPO|nr:hypothetical protein CEP51_000030 [Fusarium floridanum]
MTHREPSLESGDRASASVIELTQKCISLFEGCAVYSQNEDNSTIETRLADLRLWADGVGAVASGTASLDWRFQSRPRDLLLVKTILIMLADFTKDYSMLLAEDQPTDDAVERIDSTIENLAVIGVAIRRTGKASRRRRADARFDPRDYGELRRHLECIILLRPSKSGLETELNLSSLSTVQKRLIEANLKRRHRFVIAQKHSRKLRQRSPQPSTDGHGPEDDVPSRGEDNEETPQSGQPLGTGAKQVKHPRAPPTRSGVTTASTAEGTLQYEGKRRYVPGVARTQITALAEDAEFPRPPPNPEGRRIVKCPCCCQSILAEEMKATKKWKQHLVEDLLPYTCVIEDCPAPETAIFSTRKEWEAHVKADHRAHWRCPLCEDTDVLMESEEAIVHHFETEHKDDVRELTLEVLLPWSETRFMGITFCPLCSSYGREDSPEIVDHVLRHVYEFSLRSLPWSKPFTHELSSPIGTFTLPQNPDRAAKLMGWLDNAESGTARQIQLSTLEVGEQSSDTQNDLDDSGYVLDDEYFDAESVDESSRAQSADSGPLGNNPMDAFDAGSLEFSESLSWTSNHTEDDQQPKISSLPKTREDFFADSFKAELMTVEEEAELEALKAKRERRGKLSRKDTERFSTLAERDMERAAYVAAQEEELENLTAKRERRGKLGRKDTERFEVLSKNAAMRAERLAEIEKEKAADKAEKPTIATKDEGRPVEPDR